MIEQPSTPMPCPFQPCTARLAPRRWLARSDRPEQVSMTYPIHEVQGAGAWFGRCPASQLTVPQLTEAGRQVLREAERQYARRFAERINRLAENYEVRDDEMVPVDPPPSDPKMINRWLARGTARPLRPVDDYFPGRPADAPEPGVGEAAARPVPLDQPGQPLGRAAEMATREELNHLIGLTLSKIGEALDLNSQATDALDKALAATSAVEPLIEAANALSRAAVGTGADRPEPAEKMAEQLHVAGQTITDLLDVVRVAHNRVDALGGQLLGASDGASRYLAMPK